MSGGLVNVRVRIEKKQRKSSISSSEEKYHVRRRELADSKANVSISHEMIKRFWNELDK